jgi:ketosteroid isomerase-like protein
MSQANVEIVHQFYDAFERHDRKDVAALLHPQIEWHSIGAPLLGVEAIHGRDEALRFMFEQIGEGIEDFRAILEEVRELPADQALAVAHYEGRGMVSGAAPSVTATVIFRFEAGQIVFFQDFATRDEALEAAGLSE